MDTLVVGLGPAFIAGFAIQQLLERIDPLFKNVKNKGLWLGTISLALGLGLAFGANLKVLEPLGANVTYEFWDTLTTGLVISGGSEGINSVMKFLGYKKSEAREDAIKAASKPANQ
jgi:hypothetical protein